MGGIHLKIAIGSDHAGFHLKEHLKQVLDEFGAEYEDMGTFNEDSVDYPDYAKKVAVAVASGQFERGVLLCGTGLGMCISANKIAGIRAVTVQDEFSARLSREHNDANVLTMGGRVLGPDLAAAIVKVWLSTPFAGGRHQRRVDKLMSLQTGSQLPHE